MTFTQVQKLQLNQMVDKILNTPGNFVGGNLEMTVVLDYTMEMEQLKEQTSQIAATLKSHSPVFRNVRLNVVAWEDDVKITSRIVPMSFLQLGSYFSKFENESLKKEAVSLRRLEVLLQNLKLFHARSKLVLIVTDGAYQISDKKTAKAALNPFLKRKLLILENGKIETGTQLLLNIV